MPCFASSFPPFVQQVFQQLIEMAVHDVSDDRAADERDYDLQKLLHVVKGDEAMAGGKPEASQSDHDRDRATQKCRSLAWAKKKAEEPPDKFVLHNATFVLSAFAISNPSAKALNVELAIFALSGVSHGVAAQ